MISKVGRLWGQCSQVKSDLSLGFDKLSVSTQIWTREELHRERLVPLHSVLFGSFRVLETQISSAAKQHPLELQHYSSFIDFAFGSDDGFIAGVHRFSVSEAQGVGETKGTKQITVEFSHTGCNPREDKPLGPAVLQNLHLWYAMLLFREGIAEVLKREE